MKRVLLFAFLIGSAFGSPIPVTGSGTFDFELDHGGYFSSANLHFSGSSDGHSVELYGNGLFMLGYPLSVGSPLILVTDTRQLLFSRLTIDGVTTDPFSSLWAADLGGGAGRVSIYTPDSVLLSEDISGVITITGSAEPYGPRWLDDAHSEQNPNWIATGSFTIGPATTNANPVPEASSGILLGLGLLAVQYRRKAPTALYIPGRKTKCRSLNALLRRSCAAR